MRFARWGAMGLVAVFFLTGCGDFWQAPSSSSNNGSCTTNCTTASSGNFYILNAGSTSAGTSPEILGYTVVSGTLTKISGSPWTLPASPYAMAISPSSDLLFVSTTAGVYVYPISSGVLGTATTVTQDRTAYAVGVDTTGAWLIETLPATGGVTMAAIPIDSSTGASNGTEQTASYTVTNAALQQGQMAISPDDSNILVALGTGGTIVVPFTASTTSGNNPFGTTAKIIAPNTTGGAALSVAVDPLDHAPPLLHWRDAGRRGWHLRRIARLRLQLAYESIFDASHGFTDRDGRALAQLYPSRRFGQLRLRGRCRRRKLFGRHQRIHDHL